MNKAPDPKSYEFFLSTWQVYRKIVDGNYMYHREIFSEVLNTLRRVGLAPNRILDLGCGDGGTMSPVLAELPFSSYLGIDASQPALDLARRELEGFDHRIQLECADMLEFLKNRATDTFDAIVVSFSLHHLDSQQKDEFLTLAKSHLTPEGRLIVVDVFREKGQTRDAYLDAYCQDMELRWSTLTHDELETAIKHVRNHDFPESLDGFLAIAEDSGLISKTPIPRFGYHAMLVLEQ